MGGREGPDISVLFAIYVQFYSDHQVQELGKDLRERKCLFHKGTSKTGCSKSQLKAQTGLCSTAEGDLRT